MSKQLSIEEERVHALHNISDSLESIEKYLGRMIALKKLEVKLDLAISGKGEHRWTSKIIKRVEELE